MTSQQSKPFLEVVREHMCKDAIENNLSDKTKEKHEFMYNNLSKFLQETALVLDAHEVKIKHMEAFKIWLMTNTKARSPEHISRHLRLCRNALDHAVNQEYIEANKLVAIKLKKGPEKEVVSLDLNEVERLKAFEPDLLHEAVTRDLFLFQCYTGLSFMDLWLFQVKDESVKNHKKITFITCEKGRGKNKKEYWTELMPEARLILKSYKGKFPRLHNQSYNRTLRHIAMMCGISKHITTHIGRKTFATLKRAKGYSIPAIADMLGNTEKVARKHYVNRTKELVIAEILKNEKQ
jgi:integrase